MATTSGCGGAITLDHDSRDEVVARTAELVHELLRRNDLVSDDLISMLLTATDDVGSEFPAAAVRACGITDYSAKPRHHLRHVYLRDARQLRSDLPE
ncbi:MAG: chorismate mutase [Euzebya sp.]